ncbi:TPA: hypothetical protein NPM97_004874 [Klebsiella pneumoniae]|uniref:hypothetical protein n=1 Tax=Klebsiella pneumoniae TaxID=573 RepID=UPI0029362297|nr:hypothetical protein [Klebsiella pneumoniae]MDV2890031.1 hypothetical protein [Klebsiella pneumoniae]HCI5261028.1 hypothetical protein [Klebsiella pneumoniae]
MMAKNDEIIRELIPLNRQYVSLADAQVDIVNILEDTTTYVRSPGDKAKALEARNNGGVLEPTRLAMPFNEYVKFIVGYVTTKLFNNINPSDAATRVDK